MILGSATTSTSRSNIATAIPGTAAIPAAIPSGNSGDSIPIDDLPSLKPALTFHYRC